MTVTVDMVRRLFRKDYPKLISKESYPKPQYRPTRWAVLHGPCYGEKKFKGTLLIDLSKMLDWSTNHAKHTWSNQTAEQEAKEYFPDWLEQIDLETEAVTMLDEHQYAFLKDYYEDFVNQGWHQIYCPQCHLLFGQIDRKTHDRKQVGREISWIIDWKCLLGHQLYYHNASIRLFK